MDMVMTLLNGEDKKYFLNYRLILGNIGEKMANFSNSFDSEIDDIH